MLPLAEFHAFLKELVTLVWSHATVGIENIKSFAIAKAAISLTRLTIVARSALLVVIVIATVVHAKSMIPSMISSLLYFVDLEMQSIICLHVSFGWKVLASSVDRASVIFCFKRADDFRLIMK